MPREASSSSVFSKYTLLSIDSPRSPGLASAQARTRTEADGDRPSTVGGPPLAMGMTKALALRATVRRQRWTGETNTAPVHSNPPRPGIRGRDYASLCLLSRKECLTGTVTQRGPARGSERAFTEGLRAATLEVCSQPNPPGLEPSGRRLAAAVPRAATPNGRRSGALGGLYVEVAP